jgi:hypothetical protein
MYISSFRPTLGFLLSFLSLLVLGFSVDSLRIHSFELPLTILAPQPSDQHF